MDAAIFGKEFPMNESLCYKCINRMTVRFSPIDLEAFGLDDRTLDSLDVAEGEDVIIEQHTCLVNNQDMDYIVYKCNKFKGRDFELLNKNPFK